MKPLISRRSVSLLVAWLLLFGAAALPLLAQEPAAANEESATGSRGLPPGDVQYLPNESGQLVPVPLNATLEGYWKWLEEQSEQPEDRSPEYSVERLSLTGTADDRVANLEAVLRVRVRKETGAVTVPLQFNEAVLKDIQHTGEGDFAFNGLKNNTGYEWKIAGAGAHEIHLKMIVPLDRQLSSTRLQLTLPLTAIGSLELEVPLRDAAFKTPARSAFKITPQGQRTSITLFGLNEDLDLTWQPAPENRDSQPFLQSRTTINTKLTSEHVLLTATQRIEVVSGSIKQLQVRLPTEFQLQSVTDQNNLIDNYEPLENRPGWYLLSLMSPTSDRMTLTLNWILTRPLPETGSTFQIDGFELAGDVRQQGGELKISELPGYRLLERERRALFRIDVPQDDPPNVTRAFEFFRQPFRLILEWQKIQPLYSIDPRLELQVDRDLLTWKADLNLSVRRGSLTQLGLHWPGWREDRWRLISADQSDMFDIKVDPEQPDFLYLQFLQPQSGKDIKLSLEALKNLTDREAAEGVSIRLPRFPRRAIGEDTELLVTSRSDLRVTLSDTGELEPLAEAGTTLVQSPYEAVRRLIIPEYTHPELSLSVVPRERIVHVNQTVSAGLKEEGRVVRVRQTANYDVRFDSIETLRLVAPLSLMESLSATDEFGRELMLEGIEGSGEALSQIRVGLPESKTGQFSIQFEFDYALEGAINGRTDNGAQWTLPLVRPTDGETELSSLHLDPSLSALFEPDTDDWRQTEESPELVTYVPAGDFAREEIRFQQEGSEDSRFPVTVRHGLHTTVTGEDGVIRTRSDFLLYGALVSLTVRIPDGYDLDRISLNDQRLPAGAWLLRENSLMISPPADLIRAEGTPQRLSLEISSQEAEPLKWMGNLTCEAPELVEANPELTAPERSQRTFWLVELPHGQHLFVQPEGFSAQYLWQRRGFFWLRTPRKSPAELAEWVQIAPEDLQDTLSAGGNRYLFYRSGAKQNLVIGNMYNRLVVIVGAGFMLLIGFTLLRLPATRNAFTLLLIAAGVAFAGMWYPTSVALLLQPAILGFCLVCLVIVLDYLFRRPQLPAVVTFEDPTAGSSQISGHPEAAPPLSQLELGLGSEEPTQMKPRESFEKPMSSHVSTGGD